MDFALSAASSLPSRTNPNPPLETSPHPQPVRKKSNTVYNRKLGCSDPGTSDVRGEKALCFEFN